MKTKVSREKEIFSFQQKENKAFFKEPLESIWSYRDFSSFFLKYSIEEGLSLKPILTQDEVRTSFIILRQIEEFIKGRFKFINYLFLSPAGTGKTSLLSFLSAKGIEAGYRPIWINLEDEIPSFASLLEGLKNMIQKKPIFVFDNIHKNPKITELVSEIILNYPNIPIWLSARQAEFEASVADKFKEIEAGFRIEPLPRLLNREEIKRVLNHLKDGPTREAQEFILSYSHLPFIHLVALYLRLKVLKTEEKDTAEIFKECGSKMKDIYKAMYSPLNAQSKITLKLIAYLDGIEEDLLWKALAFLFAKRFNFNQLFKSGIIYRDSTFQLAPDFQTREVFDIPHELKNFIYEQISPKEKERFVDSLLKLEYREGLLALAEKFCELSHSQRKRYTNLLIGKREDPLILWTISRLARKDEELLAQSDYALSIQRRDKVLIRTLYNFGYAYGIRGHPEGAIRCFEAVIKMHPQDIKAHFNLALAYTRKLRIFKAVECYRQLLNRDSRYTRAWYNLGVLYRDWLDPEEGFHCFEEAYRLDPNYKIDWYTLGIAYGRRGKWDSEMACYFEAIKTSPEDNRAYFNLAMVYRKRQNIDKAIKYLKYSGRIEPADPKVWYELSHIYLEKNELDLAIKCHQRALQLDPTYSLEWNSLGTIYPGREGRIKEAEEYEEILLEEPQEKEGLYRLGVLCKERGEVDRAINYFERVVKEDPTDVNSWYALTSIYGEKGLISKQIEAFRRITRKEPPYGRAWYNLANHYSHKGYPEETRICLGEAAKIIPKVVNIDYLVLSKALQAPSQRLERETKEALFAARDSILQGRPLEARTIRRVAKLIIEEASVKGMEIIFNPLRIKQFEDYFFIHPLNVALLSLLIAQELRMDNLEDLAIGCLLHDLGKLVIPNHILNKPGLLNPEELKAVRNHPAYGWQIISQGKDLGDIPKEITYYHHECYNGSGYPEGLSQDKIPESASLVNVSNLYDSLIQDRIYRQGLSPYEAMKIIVKETGLRVAPKVGKALLKIISLYPIETTVWLNTKEIGVIKGINRKDLMRPVVKLTVDVFGRSFNEDIYLNLAKEKRCFITGTA